MERLFGRTNGLKPSEKKRLVNLYKRRVPIGRVASAELARTLAQLSCELEKPLSLLLDRGGHVLRVTVGDAKEVPIPEQALVETRLSGMFILHIHLAAGGLSRPDLSTLFLHRLDAVAALEAQNGQPGLLHLAVPSPPGAQDEDWTLLPARPYHEYLEWDLRAQVAALEEEFSRQASLRLLQDGSAERVVLVEIDQGRGADAELELAELSELARTAGGVVAASQIIFRNRLDPRYLVGRGKLEELESLAYHNNSSTLIFSTNLSAAQAREIEAASNLKVLDRTQLILDIFAQHARTPEAKAQVELAQLKYLLPRLVGKGKELSRLGGGIGTRGPGESKLESDRRKLQERITLLSSKLKEQRSRRVEARKHRSRSATPLIAVVGYTNAGKTTLMHALAKGGESGENKLFATLRPLTRKGFLPGAGEVLFTDTVGFIRHMPEDLLEAFRSTLEELREADLLLHVLDASQDGGLERYRVVEDLLAELRVEAPRLVVLSKADRAGQFELEYLLERLGGFPVSAITGKGVAELKRAIAEELLAAGVRPAEWAVEHSA